MVVDGLLALHEATLDQRWLDAARRLADAMLDLFWDPQAEGFFDTGRDHETLVVRPRSLFDSAVPCGSSVAADVLLRLAVLTGSADLERRGVETIRSVAPLMGRYPSGFGRFLAALDFHLGSPVEVAVVWPGDALRPTGSRCSPRFWRGLPPLPPQPGPHRAVRRGPGGTCRSWPGSGPGAGRPPTSARVRVPGAHDRAGASWEASSTRGAGQRRRRLAGPRSGRPPVEAGRRGAIVNAPFPATPTTQGGDTPMRFTRAVLLVAAVLLLGAAGPALAQTFVFGAQGEPVQFDPAVITDGISAKITRQIYDTLYEFKPGTTQVQPGAGREGRGLGRRQDLDAPAPEEREVPRRRAVRRQGRRLELRALDEHQAPAAREPAEGRPDLRVLRGPVRRLRRQVGHRQGRGHRHPHGEVHAQAAPGAVPPEHRDVPVRASPARRPSRSGAPTTASTRSARAPSSSSSGSRTRRSSSRRTPTTGGRRRASSALVVRNIKDNSQRVAALKAGEVHGDRGDQPRRPEAHQGRLEPPGAAPPDQHHRLRGVQLQGEGVPGQAGPAGDRARDQQEGDRRRAVRRHRAWWRPSSSPRRSGATTRS